jgi:hypothetical protein
MIKLTMAKIKDNKMNKQIKRIYDKYEITSEGEIFSYCRGARKKMKLHISTIGYYSITFSLNKKRFTEFIHRLVGKVFIPNPYNYPQVNHIDGDKSNNNVNNLEWCTAKWNRLHARDVKLQTYKINMEIAEAIRKEYATNKYTTKKLGEIFNLAQSSIWYIVNNKRWAKINNG